MASSSSDTKTTIDLDNLNDNDFVSWLCQIDSNPIYFRDKNPLFLTATPAIDDKEDFEEYSSLRAKTESHIVSSIEDLDKNHRINLLSLGFDNLFQDFLLLISLYNKGYRKINFDKLNISYDSSFPTEQSQQFRALIKQFNQLGCHISFNAVNDAEKLPFNRRYAAVFGIDLREAQTYIGHSVLDRSLPKETIKKTSHMVSQIVQAASLINRNEKAVFFIDNGIAPVFWSKTKNAAPLDTVNSLCITSNIINLINCLQDIINHSPCELFIDSAILDYRTRTAVIRLLNKYPAIKYQISDKKSIYNLLKSRENNSTLVIDDTYIDDFDPKKEPTSVFFPSSINFSSRYLSRGASLHFDQVYKIIPGKSLTDSLNEYRTNRLSENDSFLTRKFKSYAGKLIKINAVEKLINLLHSMQQDNFGPEVMNQLSNFTKDEIRCLDEGRLNQLIPIRLLRIIKLASYITQRQEEQRTYHSWAAKHFKPALCASNKIEAAKKLLTLYTNPESHIVFEAVDFDMLEQGRLGQILTPEIISELKLNHSSCRSPLLTTICNLD